MLKCVVIPKGRSISGILPHNKRIMEETELCLNKREILKCMKYGDVYAIRSDNSRHLIKTSDDINVEVKRKINERKPEMEQMILDNIGISETDKKEYQKNIQPYKNNSSQNQQRKGNNNKRR